MFSLLVPPTGTKKQWWNMYSDLKSSNIQDINTLIQVKVLHSKVYLSKSTKPDLKYQMYKY